MGTGGNKEQTFMKSCVIDISHHQGHKLDFLEAQSDGIEAVIHKASQGIKIIDPMYLLNREKIRDVGLFFGAYHFGINSDGSEQADHFLEAAQPDHSTLLVLDYEPNPMGPTMTMDEAQEFISYLHILNYRVGLYTAYTMLKVIDDNRLGADWIWWAQYNNQPSRYPKKWPAWDLWQATDGVHGPVPHFTKGIGHCDRNFYADLEPLSEFWWGTFGAT